MVFREGDVAGAMYIVIRGMCAMQGRVITGGKFFGEDMIMGGRRLADCRALTFLDVYELEKDSLDSILEDGKYLSERERCIAYMEKHCRLTFLFLLLLSNLFHCLLSRISSISKTPKQVFF